MGKESSKESLVFFKLTKEGFSGFIKLSFEEFKIHGIFITADRSASLVLKRHQAASSEVFEEFSGTYSIVKKIMHL